MEKIILASASPRRKEILEKAGIKFKIITADVDESISADIPPYMAVMQTALKKAVAVAKTVQEGEYIISADTVVCIDGRILGKPKDEADAFEMLATLRGKVHQVLTGVCMMHLLTEHTATFCESTDVYFKEVTDEEILNYIKGGEPMDKAGAYGIQGEGAFLVSKIEGDFQNVVGLPLTRLKEFSKKEFSFTLNEE